jgi:hypothetical protein
MRTVTVPPCASAPRAAVTVPPAPATGPTDAAPEDTGASPINSPHTSTHKQRRGRLRGIISSNRVLANVGLMQVHGTFEYCLPDRRP